MNTSKDRLIIYTSWQTYLWMLGVPLFLIGLDFISSRMTNTTFGSSIFNVAIVIFLAMFILGSKLLILSKDSVRSWPGLIFGKKVPVNEISQIDVKVDPHFAFNAGGIVPVSTMYLKNNNSKVLDKINLATFDKKSLALLLRKIALINPRIELNDKAKDLSGGSDTLVKKEITEMYLSFAKALVSIFVVILVIFAIIYLLKQL